MLESLDKYERRKYIRLDSVFPVEFRITSLDGKENFSDWLQGFTRNVSSAGICLEANNLSEELTGLIKEHKAKLLLKIDLPIVKNPLEASASIAWIREGIAPKKYLIGLGYEEINLKDNFVIIRYAQAKKLFIPVVLTVIILLGLGFLGGSLINMKLTRANKEMVRQLRQVLEETSIAKQKIKEINKDRKALALKIKALNSRIDSAEKEKLNQLNGQGEKLIQEKSALENKLILLAQRETAVNKELLSLDKRKATLEKANFDKMYHWLVVHQNRRTGLVISFEGDEQIANWAFIYDQSLALQAYLIFSDFERAAKVLDFFAKKAERSKENLFFNAYYANDGSPAEYIVHSGPNLWLGIAALQYIKKTQDKNYLSLAEGIAKAIIKLQNQDKDGGLRGGPGVDWYATEHNLDAYAFFNMLYEVTGKNEYLKMSDKMLNWIVQHTYDKTDVPIMRGKGDSTIATDTYAWSIAAIGPEKLEELNMNPDKIMEFAEKNCLVEVDFSRGDGKTIKIKGFDFAPLRHVARGGVVTPEWTAQMVLSYKVMVDYYNKKNMIDRARSYSEKAQDCLINLCNMIICSPSASGQGEVCLPYASQENVDTGHGWMTPKGKTTGSVAGTAYTIFAYYNYNPLKFKK